MTELEMRIIAVLRDSELSTNAIWNELNDVSIGALFVALERLEERGLVTYRTEAGGAERSGRRRRFYRMVRAP